MEACKVGVGGGGEGDGGGRVGRTRTGRRQLLEVRVRARVERVYLVGASHPATNQKTHVTSLL